MNHPILVSGYPSCHPVHVGHTCNHNTDIVDGQFVGQIAEYSILRKYLGDELNARCQA